MKKEVYYSDDPCLGFEELSSNDLCHICLAEKRDKSSIIFYSYPNGNVWFDLVDNENRMYPKGGLRMHANYRYSLYNRSGLLEALTNHREFRLTGNLYQESEIDTIVGS